MKPINILEDAEAELFEAAAFLNSEQPRLGDRLVDAYEVALCRIERFPESGALLRRRIRRVLLRGFPYGVLYRIDSSQILIVAFAHLRRRPGYWLRRLRGGV